MALLEFRSQCDDLFFQQLEADRGDIPIHEFMMHMFMLGYGHYQEEIVNQHRQRLYDLITVANDHYRKPLARLKLEPAGAARSVPFGADITRTKTVRP